MKVLFFVIVVLALAGLGYFFWSMPNSDAPMVTQTTQPVIDTVNPEVTKNNESLEIIPIEHATMVLKLAGVVVYTDPVGGAQAFSGQAPADIVVVTDIHGDHLSTSTLASVVGASTTLLVPQSVKDLLPPALASVAIVMANDESLTEKGIAITAVPMYNLPESEKSPHTKGRGNGYILEANTTRIYIAGDTGPIPEMKTLTNIDVAFVPMNLPYTMSVEDAAGAVVAFAPKKVYPYHYRGPDGLADVAKFKELVNIGNPNIEVVLLNWY